MHQWDILDYYSRKDVQEAIAGIAKDREVVGAAREGQYLKRPATILYPQDVIEQVKKGAVTFHCSVERWSQPMSLSAALTRQQLNSMRKGWDLIIDIDAKVKLDHSKAAACAVIDFLKDYGIGPSVKFSGRRGFHIAVASEAFPAEVDFKPLAEQYPDAMQSTINFIREKVRDKLMEALISAEGGVAALTKSIEGLSKMDPYEFVEIESGWGSRHLFRAPYSLHDKTWYVSVPIPLFKLKGFEPESAQPHKVRAKPGFLVSKEGEATELVLAALDWSAKTRPEPVPKKIRGPRIRKPISAECFPPCMKNALKGIQEGRKRTVFTLMAFLKSMNWDWEDIEKAMGKWNEESGASKRFVHSQLKWHQRQRRDMLPANCESDTFYRSDIKICKPDPLCKTVKNPVNYAIRKYRRNLRRRE